jgi:hypothetical protein
LKEPVLKASRVAKSSDMASTSEELAAFFDAVIMLSSGPDKLRKDAGDWATFLARYLPVFVVESDTLSKSTSAEAFAGHSITKVTIPGCEGPQQTELLCSFLNVRGVKHPLLWLNGTCFDHFVKRSGAPVRVFNAAASCLSLPSEEAPQLEAVERTRRLLKHVDLLVATSEDLGLAHAKYAGWKGPSLVLAGPMSSGGNLGTTGATVELNPIEHSPEKLIEVVIEVASCWSCKKMASNILLLFDNAATHIATVRDHISSLVEHSRHNVYLAPATGAAGGAQPLDVSMFDAIVIHYSIRLSLEEHFAPAFSEAVTRFCGPKLLFIQDEYERTETARTWIERLNVSAVFTTVPLSQRERVYPHARFSGVDFLPTLTGYVPLSEEVELFALPLEERRTIIGYRGRRLPHHYGELGQEKLRIGIDVRRFAAEFGIQVDIEVDDDHRIYGLDWYRFLGSCRATLGTESGANVFDFDGSLARAAALERQMPFSEFSARYLSDREGQVLMNQISPKIFEAIKLRTALILFEGSYSGVLQPNRHYIPLQKDYQNIAEVFARLQDLEQVRSLTDRAYQDVIASGRYSYSTFVAGVDTYLDQRLGHRPRARLVQQPILAVFDASDMSPIKAQWSVLSDLSGGAAQIGGDMRDRAIVYRAARHVWRLLPTGIRAHLMRAARSILGTDGVRWVWRKMPRGVRRRLVPRVGALADRLYRS